MTEYIKAKAFREMFVSGAANLQNNKELVDKLNVFPVPDGDTGTNMSLTISYAMKELAKVEEEDITKVAKAMSKGSLMGARGNSGVILSQIIRGIAKAVDGKEQLTTIDMAKAFKGGADTAYKAVIKPVEGTILTVIRETGDYAVKLAKKEKDIERFLERVTKEANRSLDNTPNLLKNLKDAGVVDSGGKGLALIIEGMYLSIKGTPVKAESQAEKAAAAVSVPQAGAHTDEDIKFGYCTEFILESDKIDDTGIRDIMLGYGDSLAVVGDEGVIKVHVHTNEPGNVLQEALKYGQLLTIKIENMRMQHEHILNEESAQAPAEEKEFAFISTSMGDGLATIFRDFGVDHIIEGGQTMNPSTEDFMKAINSINAKNIFILPNNSNIIMAANQAKELSEKNIIVIPTKNIPQAVSALVSFNPEATAEENESAMTEALEYVKSGQVTFAVRDTVMNGIEIREGNIIGIAEKEMAAAGDEVEEVTKELIEKMSDEDTSIITLFYGEDVTEEQAEALREELEAKYDNIDIELYYGGQPLYYYLISIE